jgi:hypothetical protein
VKRLALPILVLVPALAGAARPITPFESLSETANYVEKHAEGRVKELVAGRSLTIELDDRTTRRVALDEKDVATQVAPGVAVGIRVRVTEGRTVDGKRSLRVAPASGAR